MVDIFKESVIELPSLSKYLKYLYETIIPYLIGQPKSIAVPFAYLREELCLPKSETHRDTSNLAAQLGKYQHEKF